MSKKKVHEAIREQMIFEIESSYIYQGMRAWFTNNSWDGFAHFMKLQAEEEIEHAERMYEFLSDVGHELYFEALSTPKKDYTDVTEVFKAALEHERLVTKRIHDIYDLAISEKDHASKVFLDWFITEQVEEEATFNNILDKLELINNSPQGLFLFDKELGRRE